MIAKLTMNAKEVILFLRVVAVFVLIAVSSREQRDTSY
jgi:hypothetical protein